MDSQEVRFWAGFNSKEWLGFLGTPYKDRVHDISILITSREDEMVFREAISAMYKAQDLILRKLDEDLKREE